MKPIPKVGAQKLRIVVTGRRLEVTGDGPVESESEIESDEGSSRALAIFGGYHCDAPLRLRFGVWVGRIPGNRSVTSRLAWVCSRLA